MDAPPVTETTTGGMPPLDSGPGGTSPGTPPAQLTSVLVDETLKAHQGLSKFRDVDSLAKSYIELDKLRNERTGVTPLTDQSTPEEIAAYRQAMGIPESPEKYELGDLSFPEEATPPQEQMAAWRGVFHQLHLTPAQVQGIMQAYAQDVSRQWNTVEEARQAEVRTGFETLNKKYGAQAPQMVEMAKQYVQRRYGPDAIEALGFGPGGTSALGNNPLLIELLVESAKLTGHDKFIVADARGGMMDPKAAQDKISELWGKRMQAKDDNERRAIDAELTRLQPIAYQ